MQRARVVKITLKKKNKNRTIVHLQIIYKPIVIKNVVMHGDCAR